MISSQSAKRNEASLNVLKTLLTLLEDSYSMKDLVDKLNSAEKDVVFNNSTVSKYIQTCRFCGIKILKISNKYFVASLPFGMNLTFKDLDLLDLLQKTASKRMSEKVQVEFNNLIAKLTRFSNKQISQADKINSKMNHHNFENAIKESLKIEINFKDGRFLECIPVKIVENSGKIYFEIIDDDDKDKLISADRIVSLRESKNRFSRKFSDTTVLFRLKGNLAKRYSLRENERLEINSEPDSIVVANKGENKEILFSRLLRYDTCCEIISPKSYREEMKQILKNMLANYGE